MNLLIALIGNLRQRVAEHRERRAQQQWVALTPALLTAGEHCINELERCYTGKLPPPIELKRKKVIKL